MSSSSNRQAIDALKKLLLYESDNDKTNLLSLLNQLNIKTDSIECNDQISSVPIETDKLSALYTHYQIDPSPPDLQFDRIRQPSFYLSHSYLQPTKLRNNSSRRRKQKRFKSNSNRKKNKNNRTETDNFHYRNMITVRRISCHDILEYQSNKLPRKNERSRRTRSANLMQNKSQKYQTCSIGFQSSPKLSTLNKPVIPPSTTNSHTKILTTPISNVLFSQRDIEKKMSNSVDVTGSKVISSHDLSVSSLVSTQLRTTGHDLIKPDVTIATSVIPGSRNNFRSSTAARSNTPKNESVLTPTSSNENIQDLVDQLKTCINMLTLLLQSKTEHEKLIIPNTKSYSDQERISRKKKQPQSSSLSLSSTSIPNKNNLIFEDITVRRCNSPVDQFQRRYPNHVPTLYNDHRNELKRCLLVYCRNRDKNIISNEQQRNSHCIRNHSMSNEPNDQDVLSISKSTLILAEEDDEYVSSL